MFCINLWGIVKCLLHGQHMMRGSYLIMKASQTLTGSEFPVDDVYERLNYFINSLITKIADQITLINTEFAFRLCLSCVGVNTFDLN